MSTPRKPTPIRRRRRNSKPKLVTPAPAVDSTAVDLADVEEEDTEDLPEAAALQVDIPPAEPQQGSFLDRAKAKLGIQTKEQDVEPKVKATSGRLTKGQQQFVDLVAPIAQQVGVRSADFAWGRLVDPYYVPYLTPSDEVADKIMTPLTRIAARLVSVKYKGKVTPNGIDAAASLAAVAGYVLSSWTLYSEMKKEEQYGYVRQEESPVVSSQPRARTAPVNPGRQGQHVNASAVPVPGTEVQDVQPPVADVRYPGDTGNVDAGNLTPEQRFQYEKLASLRALDYRSRMRRSGYAGGV